MAGATIDIFKENRDEYRTPKHPTLMVIGPATYLTAEGTGGSDQEVYAERAAAIEEARTRITQTLQSGGRDYLLGRLQCQWWADEAHELNYQDALKHYWQFRLLVRIPDFLDADFVSSTLASHPDPTWQSRLKSIGYQKIDEGLCLQMLHTGERAHVGRASKRMREYARKNHLHFTAPHHEIYLPDGEGLAGTHQRTILRRPVR